MFFIIISLHSFNEAFYFEIYIEIYVNKYKYVRARVCVYEAYSWVCVMVKQTAVTSPLAEDSGNPCVSL